MNERGWGWHALEIVLLGIAIGLVFFAGSYAWSNSDDLPLSSTTVLVIIGGLCGFTTIVALICYSRGRHAGLWAFFSDLLSLM